MTIEQTVEIPANRCLTIEVPCEIPIGQVILTFTPKASAFDPRLQGAVDPAMYGKGEIIGDIIGPFFDEWGEEQR